MVEYRSARGVIIEISTPERKKGFCHDDGIRRSGKGKRKENVLRYFSFLVY